MSRDGTRAPVPIAVLASGGGSNLQALIDHFNARDSSVARVALVLSDRPDAGALARATRAGIPAAVVPVKGRTPEEVGQDMLARCDEYGIALVVLAGYLKLVPAEVVRRFAGRIVNVHPALLPKFGGPGMYGPRVHQAVLAAGDTMSGPTVHLVDEEYDRGRILAQWPVPVVAGDTPETLAARVLEAEHVLLPVVVEGLAAGGWASSENRRAGARARGGAGVEWRAPTVDDVRRELGLTHR